MLRALILLPALFATLACATDGGSILDQELEVYRYEQERYRRQDLERQYERELASSEELTRLILEVREEIAAKEAELREAQARLREIQAEVAAARAKAEKAKQKPAPAQGKPAGGK